MRDEPSSKKQDSTHFLGPAPARSFFIEDQTEEPDPRNVGKVRAPGDSSDAFLMKSAPFKIPTVVSMSPTIPYMVPPGKINVFSIRRPSARKSQKIIINILYIYA